MKATKKEMKVMILFDFESTQSHRVNDNQHGAIYEHRVHFAVAQKVSDQCKDKWDKNTKDCPACGEHQVEFSGENCLKEFCTWLFSKKHRGAFILSHYGKAYDNFMILRYLLDQGVQVSTINTGLKVMRLEVEHGIVLLDSYNFIPMRLALLPKAFGFSAKKGYFPYDFYRHDTLDYIGPHPPPETYGVGRMKGKEADDFLEWYAKQTGTFNMAEQVKTYCELDVSILREAVVRFRDAFKAETGVDPILEACTIASACNVTFRQNFLQPKTIACVPHNGYRRRERASIIATRWLIWLARTEGIEILHAGNGDEQKIGKYRVDGLRHPTATDPGTIYEFNG